MSKEIVAINRFGWEANDAIDVSRKKISNLINSRSDEIFFTILICITVRFIVTISI